MAVVKLIDKLTKTYTYQFGSRPFGFKQGATEPVPVALALRLKKIVNRNGDPMFKITGLPEVIEKTKNGIEMYQCSLFT